MMTARSAYWILSLFLGAHHASVFAAAAETDRYPVRAIRVVVPFTPGGGADLIARTVSQRMAEQLGQSMVVDNRVGADGNIGTELVARATPDGHTLLLGYVGNLAIGPSLNSRLPFSPARDFVAITQLVAAPNILVINPSVPAKDFNEFLNYVKANPDTVNFASAVVGSPGHLAGEMLKRTAGLRMSHIPYKGASQALVDVMAGQVQAMFGVSTVLPHIKTGKLRALATTGQRRLSILPNLPTIAEMGFRGFEASAWYGFLAPQGTRSLVTTRIYEEAGRALKVEAIRDRLEASGFQIIGSSPAEFQAYIKTETEKWKAVVAASGAKTE